MSADKIEIVLESVINPEKPGDFYYNPELEIPAVEVDWEEKRNLRLYKEELDEREKQLIDILDGKEMREKFLELKEALEKLLDKEEGLASHIKNSEDKIAEKYKADYIPNYISSLQSNLEALPQELQKFYTALSTLIDSSISGKERIITWKNLNEAYEKNLSLTHYIHDFLKSSKLKDQDSKEIFEKCLEPLNSIMEILRTCYFRLKLQEKNINQWVKDVSRYEYDLNQLPNALPEKLGDSQTRILKNLKNQLTTSLSKIDKAIQADASVNENNKGALSRLIQQLLSKNTSNLNVIEILNKDFTNTLGKEVVSNTAIKAWVDTLQSVLDAHAKNEHQIIDYFNNLEDQKGYPALKIAAKENLIFSSTDMPSIYEEFFQDSTADNIQLQILAFLKDYRGGEDTASFRQNPFYFFTCLKRHHIDEANALIGQLGQLENKNQDLSLLKDISLKDVHDTLMTIHEKVRSEREDPQNSHFLRRLEFALDKLKGVMKNSVDKYGESESEENDYRQYKL